MSMFHQQACEDSVRGRTGKASACLHNSLDHVACDIPSARGALDMHKHSVTS